MNAAAEFAPIGPLLPGPIRLMVRDEIDSTNDEVRRLALAGAEDGRVVVADRQTAGRGRRGAAWVCPPGEALAFSILTRPPEPKILWPRLALAAGLAVAEGLETFGVSAGIKWPNDVWLGGKKVCGVLAEAGADFAVIGIGVNVNVVDFPPDLTPIATSLRLETGVPVNRADVLLAILCRLELRRYQIERDFNRLLDAVRERCVLTGKQVRLQAADGPRVGTVEGLGDGGELLLRGEAGVERLWQADEVRVVEEHAD